MWHFTCSQFSYDTLQKANNKGADQTKQKRRLVCAFLFLSPPPQPWRQVFSHWGPYNLYVLPIMTQMGPTCNPYGFSHMGRWTTVSNTLSVPFGLLLCDTFYIPYHQGNSRAIDSRLLYLLYTHSGDVTRSEIRKSGAILDLGCLSFHHSVRHSVCLSSFRFHLISWEQLYRI